MTQNFTTDKKNSYEQFDALFREKTVSLLSQEQIHQILSQEKILFRSCQVQNLPVSSFTGNNLLKYTKDILRKNQPFPLLYTLISFASEVATYLFLYGLLYSCILHFGFHTKSLWVPVPVLYGFFPIAIFLAGFHLKRSHTRKWLLRCGDSSKKDKTSVPKGQKKYPVFLMAGCCMLSFFLLFLTNISFLRNVTWDLTIFFMIYVITTLLFGIHNTLYDSHAFSFFFVGCSVLKKASKEKIGTATGQYINLTCQQFLAKLGKTPEDFGKDPVLVKKIMVQIRSRLTTQRVYCALAFVIAILLDGISVVQLYRQLSIPLVGFFLASLVVTGILLLALVSANTLLKAVPKLK